MTVMKTLILINWNKFNIFAEMRYLFKNALIHIYMFTKINPHYLKSTLTLHDKHFIIKDHGHSKYRSLGEKTG